ncbi:MAG: hypothetical protein DME16_24855 [Candidatus Rokuibacteriota bacterium]|nr:MAG: hypothetical protein DME16_24855 [Candidatus Rokubacteria bacterium]
MAWTTDEMRVAGSLLRVRKGGAGDPVLVLHHEIGSPERLPFYDALARRFTVYVPSHPGYDGSERPGWMRNVRDVAVTYQALIAALNLSKVSVIGLGFGGWIAAEMATMAPRGLHRVVLVGAMGIKPAQSDILDEALVSYIDYVRAGFEKQEAFDQVFGAEPPTPLLGGLRAHAAPEPPRRDRRRGAFHRHGAARGARQARDRVRRPAVTRTGPGVARS